MYKCNNNMIHFTTDCMVVFYKQNHCFNFNVYVHFSSAMNDCNIISQAAERSWSINTGTGYTDPSNTLVSSGSGIQLSCSENYKIEGHSSVTCLSNGSYDHLIPHCIGMLLFFHLIQEIKLSYRSK